MQLYEMSGFVLTQAVVRICVTASLLHADQVIVFSLLSFVAVMPRVQ